MANRQDFHLREEGCRARHFRRPGRKVNEVITEKTLLIAILVMAVLMPSQLAAEDSYLERLALRSELSPNLIPQAPRNVQRSLLMGSEGLNINYFRELFGNAPVYGVRTAQDVLDVIAEHPDDALSNGILAVVGEAALRANWAWAVIMGRSADADHYFRQFMHLASVEFPLPGEWDMLFNNSATRELPELASDFSRMRSMLTDSVDPKGYIRQQLQAAETLLDRHATLLTEIGGL